MFVAIGKSGCSENATEREGRGKRDLSRSQGWFARAVDASQAVEPILPRVTIHDLDAVSDRLDEVRAWKVMARREEPQRRQWTTRTSPGRSPST